jgi:hypothetical protein
MKFFLAKAYDIDDEYTHVHKIAKNNVQMYYNSLKKY